MIYGFLLKRLLVYDAIILVLTNIQHHTPQMQIFARF